ncbi:type IX secretion system outer membrane channel protein PorV [Pedobacter riviphilus]|uniref:Type IX secretion system outer membrane channel protein PorV n=1 Tax=Pedobacter riviphilus TaxID=2766984 RepID=A0ABX6TC88_9SPHI|nr:type IX secretion system outer membrane channel protein PorV [Pedobacter riviphilus]QNR82922.1 type IX secretion system outer membrane channel protein PorV [Pedobacter riviphilus]
MNKILFLLVLLDLVVIQVDAQQAGKIDNGTRSNNLIAAAPFLRITPGARIAGMGNAGVAVEADAHSAAINAASMAYLPQGSAGIGLTYTPWMRNLVPDMNLSYLSGYSKLDERNTIGASLRYFSLGTVNLTDDNSQELGMARPSEFAVDISYARSFGKEFALGGSIRFINSNLFTGATSSGVQAGPGRALAADISGIYRTGVMLFGGPADWSMGVNISNIGTKMSYSNTGKQYFLPTELKLGSAVTFIGNESKLTLALDLNKLLIPTQPIYSADGKIISGKNPDRSVPAGIFGSFNDAPGGFSEEAREIGLSTGLELLFKDMMVFRAGYNYQDAQKGDGSYFTLGAGFRHQIYSIDMSYLATAERSNPLANTLRFGLAVNFLPKKGK